MPIYEYQCRQCDARHEVIQNFSDPPVTNCPKCNGEMKKLFSSPAIQFKGSGFYKTDYASSNSTPASAATKSEGGKSESKAAETSTKSESKSESKTSD